ncbi:MAG: nitrilase family protein [Cyclobacteriaceae bacterium]
MENLKVSLVQSDIVWENIDANLAHYEELIWGIKEETDLILLPEMFSTGFTMKPKPVAELMNGKTHNWMRMIAAQRKAVVAGSCVITEKNEFYNRLLVVSPDGSTNYYNKKHLFTPGGEGASYTTDHKDLIFELKGWKIRTRICYDLRFPIWARSKKQDDNPYEYDLIFYLANWPAPRIHAWNTLLSARAIENLSYSIGVNRIGTDATGANYPGHSAAYNFRGEEMAFSTTEEIMNVTLDRAELEEFRSKYPFQKDADQFELR